MKNSTKLTLGLSGAVVGIVVLVWFFMGIGVRNTEAGLRAQFNAKQEGNKSGYDAMYKIINQTAQVPEQYSQDFKDAYSAVLDAGAGSGTDQNAVRNLFAVATGMRVPQLDSSLYRKVQDVVESQRTLFNRIQLELLDIKREHDTLRTTVPGKWFVGGVEELRAKIVTSTKTERAFETGKDDDVNLFGGNK